MATARQRQRVRLIVEAYDEFLADVVIAIISNVHANLVRAPTRGGTPVDTGWARANWIPNFSTPFRQVIGSPDSVSDGEGQRFLGSALPTYTVERGPVFISNNVPYITLLNDGSSPQAQPGFVQAAIQEALTGLAA